ncbi:MAG: hypothetical protein EPN43_03850 [Jatrophihabitans sp.]|nr:MAG: hypothetical protein EPN43_03850 [Jatrophihabitans sp.]
MRMRVALAAATVLLTACTGVTAGSGTAGAGRATPPVPGSASSQATSPRAPSSTVSDPVATASPSGPAVPLRTISVAAQDGRTYQVRVWAEDRIGDCAAHSYGQVVQYFREHPCRGASRRLITLDAGGRAVGMSVITVGCASGPEPDHVYDYAAQFAALERADGTGGINDLLREGAHMPGPSAIPANEAFEVQSQDVGVFVFDAWYLQGPTASQDPALIALEQSLVLTAATN